MLSPSSSYLLPSQSYSPRGSSAGRRTSQICSSPLTRKHQSTSFPVYLGPALRFLHHSLRPPPSLHHSLLPSHPLPQLFVLSDVEKCTGQDDLMFAPCVSEEEKNLENASLTISLLFTCTGNCLARYHAVPATCALENIKL
eukprot:764658-Hanusia_phi.AAC.10